MTDDVRYTTKFWDALDKGRFLLGECNDCGRPYFPPGPACPFCTSQSVTWTESSGRGELYSFSQEHRTPHGFDSPILLGFVTLEDGPRVLGKIEASYEDLSIGQPVRVEAYEYDGPFERDELAGKPFFRFRPVD